MALDRIATAVGAGRYDKAISADDVKNVVATEVEKVLAAVARPLEIDASRKPFVILVVGVNGAGKTTTIGKLAAKFRAEGRSVVLGAGDTFRAAAIEQLKIWGERTGAPVVARPQGSDAAGLAFDTVKQAQETGADVVILALGEPALWAGENNHRLDLGLPGAQQQLFDRIVATVHSGNLAGARTLAKGGFESCHVTYERSGVAGEEPL